MSIIPRPAATLLAQAFAIGIGLPPIAMAESPATVIDPVARRAWFEDARFGLFMHWGLYSVPAGTWKGRTLPDTTLPNGRSWYAEWIQARLEIPAADYRALVHQFNPIAFDADDLVRQAKLSGMRYIALTAKHHDGFALWDSKVSSYDIAATPCRRDLLGELATACRKHGIKLGFYYSHWHDWDHPGGAKPHWKEQPDDAAFAKYWREKSLPQVAELIDRYDPDLFWFDTWDDEAKTHITPARRDELIELIRSRSPRCLINGRIAAHAPGDDVDFLEMGDNEMPQTWPGRPWQLPATMQHSWGWHAKDYAWKPSGQMICLLSQCAALGGNYLLNVGPMADGSFPAPAKRRFHELAGWMASNGSSIHGTVRGSKAPWGWWTRDKDDPARRAYAHVHRWPSDGLLPLGPLDLGPQSARLLETGQALEVIKQNDGAWAIRIPTSAPDPWNTVIAIEMPRP